MSINKVRKGSVSPKIRKGSKTPVLMKGTKMVYNEVIDDSIPYVDRCMGYWSPIGKTNQDEDKNLKDLSGFNHDLQPIVNRFDWNLKNGFRELFDYKSIFPYIDVNGEKTETSITIKNNVSIGQTTLTGITLTTANKWKKPFIMRVSGLSFGNKCEFLIGDYKKIVLENETWTEIPVITDEEITAANNNDVKVINSSTNVINNNKFLIEFLPYNDNCIKFNANQGFTYSPLILPNVFTILIDVKDVIPNSNGKLFANGTNDHDTGFFRDYIIVAVKDDDHTLRFGQKGKYENLSFNSSIIGKILASVVDKSSIKVYSEPNTDQVINQLTPNFVDNEINQNKFLVGCTYLESVNGYADYLNGSIGQIMLYRGNLTEDEIDEVRRYMRSKDNDKVCTGSGQTFFVKNTVEDKTGNGVVSLSIRGNAKQLEVPTPDRSVEVQGCIRDNNMKLTICNNKDKTKKQVFDLAAAIKKVDPNGNFYSSPLQDIYDEIVYRQGKWQYIKRLQWITPKEVSDIRNSKDTYNKFQVNLTNNRPSTEFELSTTNIEQNRSLCWSNRFISQEKDANAFLENGCYVFGNIITFNLPKATYPDVASATKFLQDHYTYFVYELKNPIVYDLDLPKIETYDGETWFTTNKDMIISPYMEATCKVTDVLDYQGDIIAHWKFGNKSNIGNHESKKYIVDSVGGYKLNWVSCPYSQVAGYYPKDGTIRTDKDIKSYLVLDGETSKDVKGGLINVKEKLTSIDQSWYLEIHEKDSIENYFGVKRIISHNRTDNTYVNGIKASDNNDLNKDNISIFINKDKTLDGIETKSVIIGNHNQSFDIYGATFKPSEIVLFGENLTEEQIQHNYMVSQQNCGIGLEPFGDGNVKLQSLIDNPIEYMKENYSLVAAYDPSQQSQGDTEV